MWGQLFKELLQDGFSCLNAPDAEEALSYLEDGIPIRFGLMGKPIPNVELKFARNPIDDLTLKERVTVRLPRGEVFIGPLPLQIAYKRIVLGSEKDLEDAAYLEKLFFKTPALTSLHEAEQFVKTWPKKR